MIDIRFCVSTGLFVLQMQKLSDSLSRVQNPGWLFYIYKGIILYTTQLYRVYNKPPKSIPINQSVYWNVKPRVQSQGSRPKPCAKIITWNPTKTYQKHKGFVFFVGCPAKHSCQEKNSPLHFKAMNFLTLRGFFGNTCRSMANKFKVEVFSTSSHKIIPRSPASSGDLGWLWWFVSRDYSNSGMVSRFRLASTSRWLPGGRWWNNQVVRKYGRNGDVRRGGEVFCLEG